MKDQCMGDRQHMGDANGVHKPDSRRSGMVTVERPERRRHHRFLAQGVAYLRLRCGTAMKSLPLLDASAGGLSAIGTVPIAECEPRELTVSFTVCEPLQLKARVARLGLGGLARGWAAQLDRPSEALISRLVISSLVAGREPGSSETVLLCTSRWERQAELARALLANGQSVVLARTPRAAIAWLVDERRSFGQVLLDSDVGGFHSQRFMNLLRHRFPNQRAVWLPQRAELSDTALVMSSRHSHTATWAACTSCGSRESYAAYSTLPLCLNCYAEPASASS